MLFLIYFSYEENTVWKINFEKIQKKKVSLILEIFFLLTNINN